jgi:hypothetical protein
MLKPEGFKEELLNEDFRISEARLIRDCVELIDFESVLRDKLAPKELERFAKSLESLSKKESVNGERSDKKDSLFLDVSLVDVLSLIKELLRERTGDGNVDASGRV